MDPVTALIVMAFHFAIAKRFRHVGFALWSIVGWIGVVGGHLIFVPAWREFFINALGFVIVAPLVLLALVLMGILGPIFPTHSEKPPEIF